MTAEERPSTHTETFGQLFRRLIRRQKHTINDDLALLAQGTPLRVGCKIRKLSDSASNAAYGFLHLQHGKPVTFTSRSDDSSPSPIELPRNATVEPLGVPYGLPKLVDVSIGEYCVTLPPAEIQLVNAVVAANYDPKGR